MTAAAIAAGAVVATALLALWVVRRRYLVVTVRGLSMRPALEPGDRVLFDRRGVARAARGDVVVARAPAGDGHPPASRRALYVKRIAAVEGDPVPEVVPAAGLAAVPPGELVLLGDWPHSLDSRRWGLVTREALVGVMVRRLRPRRGRGGAGVP